MTTREKKSIKEKRLLDLTLKVNAALGIGKLERKDICEATGLSMVALNDFFKEDRETYQKYCVLRRTITDIAADNIVSIVNDKAHPKNYDASKYILANFKSDLDDTLESADSSIILESDAASPKAKSSVKIVFSKGD